MIKNTSKQISWQLGSEGYLTYRDYKINVQPVGKFARFELWYRNTLLHVCENLHTANNIVWLHKEGAFALQKTKTESA